MENQDNFWQKFGRLCNTFSVFQQELKNAVQEGLSEPSKLDCVNKNGEFDYDLLEQDIRVIHKLLRKRGNVILGSHLILDGKQDLMEIKTYTQREDKTFCTSVKAKVRVKTNIPEDVAEELDKEGRVELALKLEDY